MSGRGAFARYKTRGKCDVARSCFFLRKVYVRVTFSCFSYDLLILPSALISLPNLASRVPFFFAALLSLSHSFFLSFYDLHILGVPKISNLARKCTLGRLKARQSQVRDNTKRKGSQSHRINILSTSTCS